MKCFSFLILSSSSHNCLNCTTLEPKKKKTRLTRFLVAVNSRLNLLLRIYNSLHLLCMCLLYILSQSVKTGIVPFRSYSKARQDKTRDRPDLGSQNFCPFFFLLLFYSRKPEYISIYLTCSRSSFSVAELTGENGTTSYATILKV